MLLLGLSVAQAATSPLPLLHTQVSAGWNLVYGFVYMTQLQSSSTVLSSDIQAIYAFIEQQWITLNPFPYGKQYFVFWNSS